MPQENNTLNVCNDEHKISKKLSVMAKTCLQKCAMLIVINKKKFKKTKGNIFVMFIWFCNLKMSHIYLFLNEKA